MSLNSIIKNLLGIQDENIVFSDDCMSEEVIDGVRMNIVDAKLMGEANEDHCCKTCEQSHIIKHGFGEPTHVLLPKPASRLKTILRLRKQRYFCKNCKATSFVATSLVDYRCSISNPLKLHIFHDACKKRSETDVAYDNNVSNTTVARIIDEIYKAKQPRLGYLPKVLLFDEFKSTKDAEGAMSFLMLDGDEGKIIDILESRRLTYLKRYFRAYTKEAREKVTLIVIDMYKPYMTLIEKMFPNAMIVLDRFHIVGLVNTAMKFTRIHIMKQFSEETREYRRLKYDWELIQQFEEDLSGVRYYCRRWKAWITNQEKMDWMLNVSEELAINYRYYQDVLKAVKERDKQALIHLMDQPPEGLSGRMTTAVRSMLKYRAYTLNALDTDYSNGRIEGTINFIKVIKRIAFGYRSFVRFKARILMIHEYDPIKIERKKKLKAREERKRQKRRQPEPESEPLEVAA